LSLGLVSVNTGYALEGLVDIVKNDVGKNGFEHSFRIYFKEYPKAVGFLAFGGNKDSYQIYINGEGCGLGW